MWVDVRARPHFLTLTFKVYCTGVQTGNPAGHFLIAPLMRFAVSKTEESDGNKGGEVVRSRAERKSTAEEDRSSDRKQAAH